MKPTVGRTVHYVSYGTARGEYLSECRAAIVTEVDDAAGMTVGLAVLNPTGLFFHPVKDGYGCPYNEGGVPDRTRPHLRAYPGGTWHWPERVEEST